MADKDFQSYFDPSVWDEESIEKDVSQPVETDYDAHMLDIDDFEAPDVSEPRAPRKEMEIINEALAIRRREWFKAHMLYVYAVIGVIVVALTALGIHLFNRSTNPMSRLAAAVAQDFSSSFDYDVKLTENGGAVMSYQGAIELDRSKHEIEAFYQADYNSYSYTGAVYADTKLSVKGSSYNDKWSVYDCTDDVQNFFDFDRTFRSGGFNGGAFLRFIGMSSDFSTREMEHFAGVVRDRLSTDSTIATITTSSADGGTRYDYAINLPELLTMIKENGASVFYRATDYDDFVASYDLNKHIFENSACSMSFTVDEAGYLTVFEVKVTVEGTEYGLSCNMSSFGSADAALPEEFLKAAAIETALEQ